MHNAYEDLAKNRKREKEQTNPTADFFKTLSIGTGSILKYRNDKSKNYLLLYKQSLIAHNCKMVHLRVFCRTLAFFLFGLIAISNLGNPVAFGGCIISGTSPWFIAKIKLSFDESIPGISFEGESTSYDPHTPKNGIYGPTINHLGDEPLILLKPLEVGYLGDGQRDALAWKKWIAFIESEIKSKGPDLHKRELSRPGAFEDDASLYYIAVELKAEAQVKIFKGQITQQQLMPDDNGKPIREWNRQILTNSIPYANWGIEIPDKDGRPGDIAPPKNESSHALVAVHKGRLHLITREITYAVNPNYEDGAYARAERRPCHDAFAGSRFTPIAPTSFFPKFWPIFALGGGIAFYFLFRARRRT
jgi:hypothetical protein